MVDSWGGQGQAVDASHGATRTLPYEGGGTWSVGPRHSKAGGLLFVRIWQRLRGRYTKTCRRHIIITIRRACIRIRLFACFTRHLSNVQPSKRLCCVTFAMCTSNKFYDFSQTSEDYFGKHQIFVNDQCFNSRYVSFASSSSEWWCIR